MLGSLLERTALQEIAAASSTPYRDAVVADKPILWWRLGDASGSTLAADSSTNNLPGTYKNSPTLGSTGLVESETGYAVTLGEGKYIELAHNTALNHGDVFTYEAWIKPSAIGTEHCICFKQGTGGTTAKFVVNTEGKLLLRVPGFANLAIGKTVLSAGSTYHVAATKTGSTNKVYVNGVDDTASTEAREVTNNSGTLRAGSEGGEAEENFDGVLDELAWYSTALSAERVLAHYEAALEEEEGETFTESAEGTIGVEGTFTEEAVFTESIGGTENITGSVSEAFEMVDAQSGTREPTGSFTESLEYPETASGEVTVEGAGTESLVFTETASGTQAPTGSFTEAVLFEESAEGYEPMIGVKEETFETEEEPTEKPPYMQHALGRHHRIVEEPSEEELSLFGKLMAFFKGES